MALVEHWRTDFDTDAKTNKFFYTPFPSGLSNVADVARVVQDGVSCVSINIGSEVPTVEYFRTFGVGASDGYTKMIADVANQPNGAIAYCYSSDSTKHGRYVKAAGAWGARTGPVTPKMADDENHRRVAQIRLLFQSWGAAGDAFASGSHLGYPNFATLNASIGRPATHDLSGWVQRFRMRAIGMSMGRYTKLCQHWQTRIPGMPNIGTYTGAGLPYGSRAFVNAINQATCISDQLGFGGGGLYDANAVEYQADSGWIDVDIPLEPLWSYWLSMGGNDDKQGKDPATYAQSVRYVVSDPAVWAKNWTGNSYMLEAKFNPDPFSDLPVIPDNESVRGQLLISSMSFLRAA